jgi:hypothetical protein
LSEVPRAATRYQNRVSKSKIEASRGMYVLASKLYVFSTGLLPCLRELKSTVHGMKCQLGAVAADRTAGYRNGKIGTCTF